MSKKVISILLSAAMLVAMLCVGIGAVTASADDTYTYYFLAADNFFKTEAGASNTSVGVYWWQPSEVAAWPGIEMTAAPEVGENVFKIEGVSPDTTTVIFNAFVDAGNPADPALKAVAHQTVNINTEGYDANEAYEGCPECDNFNGMIYVLNRNEISENELSGAQTTGGAWFALDSYKDNATFYGSYGFAEDTESKPEETTSTEEPADTTGGKKYHAGDTVVATMTAGGIAIDGAAAKLGAYNYDITYNADVVKFVSNADKTTGGMPLVNSAKAGVVKLATMAAMGLNEDFSGDKAAVAEVTFEVTADTDDLGIEGKCSSLTAVTTDGSSTKTLVGVSNPDDPYTKLELDVTCPHEPTDSTPSEVDSTPSEVDSTPSEVDSTPSEVDSTPSETPSKTDSKTDSKKDDSKTSSKTDSKKETNDKASSNTSKGGTTGTTGTTGTSVATVQTSGMIVVTSLIAILMAAAAVVLYSKKKTEE